MPEPSQRLMKMASRPVARHDLLLHLGHELEVVRAKRARHPHLGRGPVPARLARGVHGNPIRVRRLHIVVGRVRVSAGDDDHAQLAAARDELAKDDRGRPAMRCGDGTEPWSGNRPRTRRR